jgi:peptidyl-tRNA hydrolase, PTH1 family
MTYSFATIRAIIGLGNPGAKYYRHRHSIGFVVLDELARQQGASWRLADKMEYTSIRVGEHEIYLIKPQTFMNSSGQVMPWLAKKGIKPDQLVVVHDELEKKLGQVLLSFAGSHKGHNGLKSIIGMVGPEFWRLKFGVGRPDDREEVPNYVLTDFPRAESEQLPLLVDKAIGLLLG